MEYYGREPSSDFFAHYGVRGMKWGVRKAIERRDISLLSNHHSKAMRKLEKLKEKADRNKQKENAKGYAALGALGLGAGALGGLASYGLVKGQIAAQRAINPYAKSRMVLHPVGLYGMSALSAGGGLASLGASAASAYRATKFGNKRAVNKYKKFKSEMDATFKGTRFGKNGYAARVTRQMARDAKAYLKQNSGHVPDASRVIGDSAVHAMVPYVPSSGNNKYGKKKRRK